MCVYTCTSIPPISMIVYVVCEFESFIYLFDRRRFDEDYFNGRSQCYFLVVINRD